MDLKTPCEALEAAFFRTDDPRLVESHRELHTLDITSGLWAEVSGLRHPRLLELWAQWELPTATVAALALVPVAAALWADSKVEPKERREVLDTLGDTFFFGTIVKDIVNAWLDRRPDPALLQAWDSLVGALVRAAAPADQALLAQELLWAARELSHRGAEEKAQYERLARAFLV
ncbi:MAG: hypothetical protein WCG80_15775 [Spirochaetales bacterium]